MNDINEVYDVCIIGGGINGAGIANYASAHGLKVYLCEKDDFASKTSSKSTKLIHGGLRYLEHYEFRLVREALKERAELQKIARQLITPLDFILLNNPKVRNRWLVRAGLFLYDLLAGLNNKYKWTRTINLSRSLHKEELNTKNINNLFDTKKDITGFIYNDLWVDDARLVILNIIQAQRQGAVVEKNSECIHARYFAGKNYWDVKVSDSKNHKERKIRCKIIINTSGPWVNEVISNVISTKPSYNIRLVKGSHFIVPKLYDGKHSYVLQHSDSRIIFVIPYEDEYSLIGTTEVDVSYEDIDKKQEISQDEILYLQAVCNLYFKKQMRPNDIVWAYSGVRPLIDDNSEDSSGNTRDYFLETVDSSVSGKIINVYGGKITTYRKLSSKVVDLLLSKYNLQSGKLSLNKDIFKQYLPGCITSHSGFRKLLKTRHPWLTQELIERYSKTYGSLAFTFLEGVQSKADLGHDYGSGLHQKEVDYLIKHEFATTTNDILWRRTKLGIKFSDKQQKALAKYIRDITR